MRKSFFIARCAQERGGRAMSKRNSCWFAAASALQSHLFAFAQNISGKLQALEAHCNRASPVPVGSLRAFTIRISEYTQCVDVQICL